jgi:hypothetical protein
MVRSMSDQQHSVTTDGRPDSGADGAPERGELVSPGDHAPGHAAADSRRESVEEPAKVMRIGSMIKQLLDEVRTTTLDEPSRDRLRDIYDLSIAELSSALSDDLSDELRRLATPFSSDESPSDAELRVAKAQLVGWLEGLFHGIQATLFAQQVAARQQLEQMRSAELPSGDRPVPPVDRPGTYL